MKKILLIIITILPLIIYGQNISSILGLSSKGNMMYGIELTTNSFGFFTKKYTSDHNYPIIINRNECSNPINILHDGNIFGITYNIKSYNNLILNIGCGNINEYTLYENGMMVKKDIAFDVGFGKKTLISKYITLGANVGVNTSLGIFGNMTIGVNIK